MPGDLGLALPQYFNQIADAHFAARNQIQQAQPCAVGKSREEWNSARSGDFARELMDS
jgi:hypothetical protein